MSFAKVYSAQNSLTKAHIVSVEVDVASKNLHSFSIVGLPDKAVEESKDRVSAALKNTKKSSPKTQNQKIVISLAPADLKKTGPAFDLSMALAYLLSNEDIKFDPKDKLFTGELSLDGFLKPINGALPITMEAKKRGFKEIYLPKRNAKEAALVKEIFVYGVESLEDVIEHIDEKYKEEGKNFLEPSPKTKVVYKKPKTHLGFSDIRGQGSAKRGLEIAAAGGHNVALSGPPGTGKTLLARAFAGILPNLPFEDALEVTAIHSSAGSLEDSLITYPPFRSPHHTSSHTSLIGGGSTPKPGEITLAHKGVLFLDEFPEFDRRVIESLREPMEERRISISRSGGSATYPADIMLIAAMNPCPCGNYGSEEECSCGAYAIARYRRKMSGPIMDRIDIWLNVPKISYKELSSEPNEEDRKKDIETTKRIESARNLQEKRKGVLNSKLSSRDINKLIKENKEVVEKLNIAAVKHKLSPRGYHRVLKVARTIADLENSEEIKESHILEALSYRPQEEV